MLTSLIAWVAMAGTVPAEPMPALFAPATCCVEDWRQELPIAVQDIVARVDQQEQATEKQPQDEEAKKVARHQADLKSDVEMGKKYAEEIAKDPKMKVSTNADMIARVQRLGAEFAQIANDNQVEVSWGDPRLNPFQYEFRVLQGDDVNAFSIPGGFIYFYEGLLKYAESDDELAGVMAHEIGHASFRHIATLRREASKIDVIQIPLILVAILTGGATAQGVLIGGSLLGTALTSGWSVKAEQSADFGAFQYMRKSKYNPVGILTLMERLAYDERSKPLPFELGIYRTHPPSRERAQAISRRLIDAGIPIRRSQVTQTLKTQIKPGDDGTVDLWFANIKVVSFGGTEALSRADLAATNLDAFMDGIPKIFEVANDGNVIEGKGRELFAVTEDDALASKAKVPVLVEDVIKNLKRVAYDVSYRVWDAQF